MKSIMHDGETCYICGGWNAVAWHHIFYGTANRPKSEKYGLKIKLCSKCHNEKNPNWPSVHHNKELRERIYIEAQEAFNEYHEGIDFFSVFKENHL